MQWHVKLSDAAEQQLARLQKDAQRRITQAIDVLEADPFRGDVIPLKGKQWHGRYRKRVGRYRLIFVLHHDTNLVEISAILIRDEKTYR